MRRESPELTAARLMYECGYRDYPTMNTCVSQPAIYKRHIPKPTLQCENCGAPGQVFAEQCEYCKDVVL